MKNVIATDVGFPEIMSSQYSILSHPVAHGTLMSLTLMDSG
jgi:hypothetical protein